jgi:soluble P-type ATPase
MLEISIPGYKKLQLEHLVLDYNGTLACDGELIEGVEQSLERLAQHLEIHVVTADTFGKVRSRLENAPSKIVVLPQDDQHTGKRTYVEKLGAERTACVGNGRNDRLMLESAALGIAVVEKEGAAVEAIVAADVVCPTILAAFELLMSPLRMTATLRS